MLKVSRILKSSSWLHAWIDPDGTVHDTSGEAHGGWAEKNLRKTDKELLEEGWVRVGSMGATGYINSQQGLSDSLLSKAQKWLMVNCIGIKEVIVEIPSMSLSGFFSLEDFLSVNHASNLRRLQEVS